jgi:uncharacterized protein (TIGR04255 family)
VSNEHPTYPNPTIQEAVCEIHFRLPDGVAWKSSLFGELFKRVQSEFPELEPVAQIGLQVQLEPSGVGHTLLPMQHQIRYKHASRNLLLQLSERTLAVNVMPKYPGWMQMSKDILDAWAAAREVIKPARITRIGLRCINRINRSHPDESPGDWLAPSDYIPKAVLSSLPGFLSRLEAHPTRNSRRIVTLGEAATSPDSPQDAGAILGAILLDIDCIVEKEIGVDDQAIIEEITVLHDAAWEIFSASRTPRLEQLLRGDKQ